MKKFCTKTTISIIIAIISIGLGILLNYGLKLQNKEDSQKFLIKGNYEFLSQNYMVFSNYLS
jgi:hypothetical protein